MVVETKIINGVEVFIEHTAWYQNVWLGISALLVIITIIILGFYLFKVYLKNRLIVIIHMPDKSRRTYSYKKFVGSEFKIDTGEKTQDNTAIKHTYFFKPECIEIGYWGRYIEYDYKISEPLNISDRHEKQKNMTIFYKFISSILDTDLVVDLLLSAKFKDFVKFFLIATAIMVFIVLLVVSIMPFAYHPVQQCVLLPSNLTDAVIKSALRGI